MNENLNAVNKKCQACLNGLALGFDVSMAFQPIVDIAHNKVFSYEALVRGVNGESATEVYEKVNDDNLYAFDQACRVIALQLASNLNITTRLNINFMPNAVYNPENCIKNTLEIAESLKFPIKNIIFEVIESEKVVDHAHLLKILNWYKSLGFKTAIDNFGAGNADLNLIAEFQPQYVKLDLKLISNIDRDIPRQHIVSGVVSMCKNLNIEIMVGGVETKEELVVLQDMGIQLFQGYFFAKPSFEAILPGNEINFI